MLSHDKDEDSLTLRRNQNELGVWREADHPNLVPLLATIDKGGLKSIVTPFYNNGDLMKYLKLVRYHLVSVVCTGIFRWNEPILPSSCSSLVLLKGSSTYMIQKTPLMVTSLWY